MWFIINLYGVIDLIITAIYNDVQLRWVLAFYQMYQGSQTKSLHLVRPSGLSGVGEEVKLNKLGF
jgi:hypothetical protein